MTKESKYFIINYSENEMNFIDKLVNVIDKEARRIMDYFEIDKIDEKFKLQFISTKKEFSKFIEDEIHFKDDDHGIGFVKDKIMYCLSFNDYKNTYYSFYTFENFVSIIIHEFVHACHEHKTNGKSSIRCINEGLACYLSNQIMDNDFTFNMSLDEAVNDKYVDYNNYYLLTKYILDNYDKEYCDKILYDKDFARKEIANIYNTYANLLRK